MQDESDIAPPIVLLKYKKGELILKEGDYGISIYKIIRGKVEVFKESDGNRTTLAVLGPGEMLGEMTFLSGRTTQRSASAAAYENAELEAWHPDRLSSEYERMPPVIKSLANQVMNRLDHMNKLVARLTAKRREMEADRKKGESVESKRAYYRKEMDVPCFYRPLPNAEKVRLSGRTRDISMGGIGLTVSVENAFNIPHEPGDAFMINMFLPDGKEFEAMARLVFKRKAETEGKMILGMSFTLVQDGFKKNLGFYLM